MLAVGLCEWRVCVIKMVGATVSMMAWINQLNIVFGTLVPRELLMETTPLQLKAG